MLGLVELPDEGGMWAQVALDEHSSAIYYLLAGTDFSAMHRLPHDEIYHFYAGAPLELLVLGPDGHSQQPRLGTDLASGERPAHVVPGGHWQGSRSLGSWTLVGTTMTPPFSFDAFELGDRSDLQAQFPEHTNALARLTRSEHA